MTKIALTKITILTVNVPMNASEEKTAKANFGIVFKNGLNITNIIYMLGQKVSGQVQTRLTALYIGLGDSNKIIYFFLKQAACG